MEEFEIVKIDQQIEKLMNEEFFLDSKNLNEDLKNDQFRFKI